jgi:hypothetical protein
MWAGSMPPETVIERKPFIEGYLCEYRLAVPGLSTACMNPRQSVGLAGI